MKRGKKKELKDEFVQSGFFIGAIMFSLGALMKFVQDGTIIFLLANGIIILLTIIISIWSYINRIRAIAFLIGTVARINMFFLICLSALVSLIPNKVMTCLWVCLLFSPIILVMLLAFISEYRIKAKRISLWEKYKKINLEQGHYNILVIAPVAWGSGKGLGLITAFPIFSYLLFKYIYKAIGPDYSKIIGLICGILLTSLMALILARTIGILVEIWCLQRKQGIVFTTEFREELKKKK